ncbi:hypothetical protein GF367_04660 [Candidatus Woesearchaeota archaeon]|nr:hypothetical protein [Candidatus Woesearchaeota archaeon]
MKHEWHVTVLLVIIFLLSQLVGLFLVQGSLQDITCEVVEGLEECEPAYTDTVVGARPETRGFGSLLYIIIGVGVGTALLLLIAKYQKTSLWRVWFFIAVWLATSIALGVVMPFVAAWVLGLLLAAWKLWRPNIVIYNVAEVLMYAGIAVLIVPILDVFWMVILLLLISAYDMVAVWKSRHMVTMAKFITGSNAFAGLVIPYDHKKKRIYGRLPRQQRVKQASLEKGSRYKNAILGGGDITFPLLFAGVVMQGNVVKLVQSGVPFLVAVQSSFLLALIVSLGATVAIAGLFLFAQKDKFYPAMPFVTAGCLLGWIVTLLV